jgi:hypothetical protein
MLPPSHPIMARKDAARFILSVQDIIKASVRNSKSTTLSMDMALSLVKYLKSNFTEDEFRPAIYRAVYILILEEDIYVNFTGVKKVLPLPDKYIGQAIIETCNTCINCLSKLRLDTENAIFEMDQLRSLIKKYGVPNLEDDTGQG